MPYEITQYYLEMNKSIVLSGSGDFAASTPTEVATRFSDPGGMQG